MHRVVVPKLSGIHRFACLSLYRALLRQCARLPPTIPNSGTINHLVRKKFRRYRTLQSPSQTVNALKAGYEALDLLHSASQGNQKDIDHLSALLENSKAIRLKNSSEQRALAEARPLKPLSKTEQKKAESRRQQDATALRHPNAEPILSRPRPVVSGRRRVPVLVNARGIPFLRIKKPQPQNLSRVIRNKLDRRWKWIERRDRLEIELLFAKDEDYWDRLVVDEESPSLNKESPSWADAVKESIRDVVTKISESDRKNKELAEAMWNIVLAEKKLAEEEEAERKKRMAEQEQRQKEATDADTESSSDKKNINKGPSANAENHGT
ncbi:hypothetical protein VTN77DRAFT_6708 [Rasamsonia byssochlamydoides]|uniref:uncharacterized protein n=1 Tax=Rasamsonia byssochlamydoides TaxID=89139 RepID=UPI00374388C4